MRFERLALLTLVALAAGCMDAADYTEAITGERPEVSLPPPPRFDAAPEPDADAAPPPDAGCIDPPTDCQRACRATCSGDRWRCPIDGPPDVCGGGDTDCDGLLDEQAPSPSEVGPGEAMCCDGRDDPPCNGAPPGVWLDPGWAFVPDDGGVLVMETEITVGAWATLSATRDLPPRACARRADGAHGAPDDPMECVDLFGAAAFANAWSCARGRMPCYRIGDDPARPDDALDRLGVLTFDPACTGARLATPSLFATLAAAAPTDCAAAWCGACAADTVDPQTLAPDLRGLRGVRGNVREWIWPGGEVDADTLVAPAGGHIDDCGDAPELTAGGRLADSYALVGLRLVCPAEDGTTNACTGPARGGGLCR